MNPINTDAENDDSEILWKYIGRMKLTAVVLLLEPDYDGRQKQNTMPHRYELTEINVIHSNNESY